jgi:alkylated DNA repair dioxygenase AlkB
MNQLNMFSANQGLPVNDLKVVAQVNGLRFMDNYISATEHEQIVHAIDNEPWLDDLKRRVQHYGFKYNYKSRSIDHNMYIGALPAWSHQLCRRLVDDRLINYSPDQIIVNEYLPGQGIANHIDCEPCFNDTIISLSLISSCVMDIINKDYPSRRVEMLLPPGSLVVLSGEARYRWTHGIAGRRVDEFNGQRIVRERRISLTFRKVILRETGTDSCHF